MFQSKPQRINRQRDRSVIDEEKKARRNRKEVRNAKRADY